MMTASTPHRAVEYVLVGHVSADLSNGEQLLGGTAAYSGLTARAMGLTTGILTSARPDFDLSDLGEIDVERVPSESNTSYENTYPLPGQRRQILHSRATILRPDHLPPSWRSAPIVHLGPIADEIDAAMLSAVDSPFIGLTPQGWMRSWDTDGVISPRKWRPGPELAGHVSAVILSDEDLGYDAQEMDRLAGLFDPLVVTRASQGATLFSHGRTWDIPAIEPPRVRDLTGAGDIFAAAFFIHYAEAHDPLQAALFANYIAGVGVARTGLNSIPRPEEISAAREAAA